MELSIQALEQLTNPIEVINLLGRDLIRTAAGHYTTTCPKCENKLHILDREFVCENNSCVFRAGSVADYIVASGASKWENVIVTLDTILHGRLRNTLIFKNQKQIIELLKHKRRVFDFFLRQGLQQQVANMAAIQYRNAVRSQGIDPELLRWSVFITTDKETETLKDIIKKATDKDLNIDGTNIILPYFSDHHTVSHLVVLRNARAKPEKVSVFPARISYFGLLQRHPNCTETHAAATYAEAAKLNTQYGRNTPECICLHTHVDATATGASFVPDEMKYITVGDDMLDFRNACNLQRYMPLLNVSDSAVYKHFSSKEVTGSEFILNCFIKELKKGSKIKNLIPLVDLTPKNRKDLLLKLHANRYFDQADELRSYFQTLPIFNDERATLFHDSSGYTLRKNNGDEHTVSLTNFTISLEHNIVFAEATDIFHAGNVVFNGSSYPLILRQDELDRIADIEKAVRRATTAAPDTECSMPTIKEKGPAKYITSYLREQVSQLPKTEGLPLLGWSPRRSNFYAPFFIAEKKGTKSGKRYLHPSIPTLESYSVDIEDTSKLFMDLPEEIVNILNQSATFITRSFLSMPVKPVAIYNTAEARRLLSEMFSSLGQTTQLQLNHNMRGEEMPGIRGFPFYAAGYTYGQVVKSSLSGFILCDSGEEINRNFDTADIHKAKQALQHIVKITAEWALKTNAQNFSQARSVSLASAYSAEGASIIIDSCGLQEWPYSKTPFVNIDGMLQNIRFDEVKKYFIRDINRHVVQIKKEALDTVANIPGFQDELRRIAQQVDIRDSSIDVDSESMMDALRTFYHQTPVLSELFDGDKLMGLTR